MPGKRSEPLRPHDPRRLGSYELVGRLGEGGMGTVYLARTAGGTPVAVKVVRTDLAPDHEFRRRFRSEVDRARQVPPFCTAEVLDADPDHEHPYLVVEFVDGPTLAEVVEQRGPLTASNLHGVAIGVATALTAIHGAGVIHRDLKPRNVLLAPGSPKVIDFGIARAMEATTRHTGVGQVVGTLAYMAPERFGDGDAEITAAADVFAWGGVVAYAGTGRTPFGGDSMPATAGRILTQPPDLTGLSGPLADLVASALHKNPADRPTARELLDLLVGGPSRPPATAAALAGQPGLRAAARQAQSVTGLMPAPAGAAPVPTGPVGAAPVPAGPVGPLGAIPVPAGPVGAVPAPAGPPGAIRPAGPQGPDDTVVTPTFPAGPFPAAPVGATAPAALALSAASSSAASSSAAVSRGRWFTPIAVGLLLLAVLAAAGMVIFAKSRPGRPVVALPSPPATSATTSAPVPVSITDDLAQARFWQARTEDDGRLSCSFDNALVVRIKKRGLYKCRGPQDELPRNLRAAVGVRLLTGDVCAAIWFRFRNPSGYLLRVCPAHVYLATHKESQVSVLRTIPLDDPIEVGAPSTRIGLQLTDDAVTVTRDGTLVGTVGLTDAELTGNRLVLGVYTADEAPLTGSYAVAYDHIDITG